MTLHLAYSSNIASGVIDISTSLQMPSVQLEQSAEEGALGSSTVTVDDPNGVLNLVGHRTVWLWESSESPGNQMIGAFYVGQRSLSRGPTVAMDGIMVTGSDRRWTVSLDDENVLLTRRVITSSDGNRPAENDTDRINWLLGTRYLDNIGNSASFVSGDSPVPMDAADLRGQTAYDVISDCANRSGKNFYAFYNPATDTSPPTYVGSIALWYDLATSSNYASSLRLSNVRSDIDNTTTFAMNPDATLSRDPARVVSGVYLPFVGGSVYHQNTTTANTFATRDAVAPNANVKTTAKASPLAVRYLTDNSSEDDRITCHFVVPKEKVNIARKGQLISVKFTHFSDYSSFTTARVLHRTVTQLDTGDYDIALVLSPTVVAASSQSVFALLNAQVLDDTRAPKDAGWTALGSIASPNVQGLTLAQGPGSPGSSRSYTWEQVTNQGLETAAVQIGNVTGPLGSVVTGFSLATGNAANLSRSLGPIVATQSGVIVAGIWIHNFDSGGQILTAPGGGFVTAYQTSLTGYDRNYGMVNFGYLPVTAGSYTLQWTMSNSVDDWFHHAIAVFVPTTATAIHLQDATKRTGATTGVTATFPGAM